MSEGEAITILIADDDEEDRVLTQEALSGARLVNDLRFVVDGQDLMDYLRHEGEYTAGASAAPVPGIILLDLNMPKLDGREALAEIKSDPGLMRVPVIVLTTSSAERDVLDAYKHRANAYVTKPIDLDEFVSAVASIEQFWLTFVRLPEHASSS